MYRMIVWSCISWFLVASAPLTAEQPESWRQHDRARPHPPIVAPGGPPASVPPPSDAIVLFDGKDLRNWQAADGGVTRWKVEDGCMMPTPDSGGIQTHEGFGDIQLHAEWMAPTPPQGEGQGRGNSGIYIMGEYEVQVLDSFENVTYADGQAAALYGQYPPLANASLPPGTWQNYDIVFRRPRFAKDGTLESPARITVFHNGVLVQEGSELFGPTNWLMFDRYTAHPDALPISLQDHGNPVRFRNIWLRKLPEPRHLIPAQNVSRDETKYTPAELDAFCGTYTLDRGGDLTVRREGRHLRVLFFDHDFALQSSEDGAFRMPFTDITLRFAPREGTLLFDLAGAESRGVRQDK